VRWRSRSPASIEDLYRVDGKAEIVNGEIVQMSPTGWRPGHAAQEVCFSLRAYARQTQGGVAVGDNVGFVVNLRHRISFSPDAAFHTGPLPRGLKFIEGAPAFAVEVRSEDDYGPKAERELAAKRADYFAAGTQVVWDVDLEGAETVRKYSAADPAHPAVFRRGETADAEPAVPGWSMPVDDLFA
jgi:Uma2 family endonuclease